MKYALALLCLLCASPAFAQETNVIQSSPAKVSGAVKSNGSGVYTQSACADLSNGASGCSNIAPLNCNSSYVNTNPATISATAVMMGLGASLTCTPTGSKLLVLVSLFVQPSKASSCPNVDVTLKYGTGVAPTLGAASTGTTAGIGAFINTCASSNVTVPITAYITGLTPGTPYWFDIATNSDGTATTTIGRESFTAMNSP